MRKLISRIISNSEVLDANKLPKIKDNRLLRTQVVQLYMNLTQYFLNIFSLFKHSVKDLYTNGSIAFSTLLSLVSLASVKMLHRVNIADSSDLSQCLLYVEAACKNIKILRTLFVGLDVKLTGIHWDEQRVSQRVTNVPICLDTSNTFIVNRDILLESPEINFDLDQRVNDDHFDKTLCSSPVEGTGHKNYNIATFLRTKLLLQNCINNFQISTSTYLKDTNVNIVHMSVMWHCQTSMNLLGII